MLQPTDSRLRTRVETIWCVEKRCPVEVTFGVREKLFRRHVQVVECPAANDGNTCCAQGCIQRFRLRAG